MIKGVSQIIPHCCNTFNNTSLDGTNTHAYTHTLISWLVGWDELWRHSTYCDTLWLYSYSNEVKYTNTKPHDWHSCWHQEPKRWSTLRSQTSHKLDFSNFCQYNKNAFHCKIGKSNLWIYIWPFYPFLFPTNYRGLYFDSSSAGMVFGRILETFPRTPSKRSPPMSANLWRTSFMVPSAGICSPPPKYCHSNVEPC